MSSAYTPILVGVATPVLEILLLSKMAKFPFRPMDYSPWSSKILIDQNRLKKFMQVGIDELYICTNSSVSEILLFFIFPLKNNIYTCMHKRITILTVQLFFVEV